MKKRWDVLGFGAVAVDDLIYLDSFPAPNSKTRVRRRQREGGGLVATALVAAARLGACAAYAAVLGEDELSRWSVQELKREGVDCASMIYNAPARPHHSTIIVDASNGERSILSGNDGVMQYPVEAVTQDLIAATCVLLIDHTIADSATRILSLARRCEVPVVADVERADSDGIKIILEQVEHLIIGLDFARRLTGETEPAEVLRKLKVPARACCALTDGENGCWYGKNNGAARHLAAWQVDVVDTTGCGDVFHGAYAASIARGESIEMALRVATIAAGLKATQPGGRSGIPDRAVIDRLMDDSAKPEAGTKYFARK